MTESDLKLQIVIQGLGLLVALVLVIWLYTIYQRWLSFEMLITTSQYSLMPCWLWNTGMRVSELRVATARIQMVVELE